MAGFISGATPEHRKRVASSGTSYSLEFWKVMDSLGMTARVRGFQKRAAELLDQAIQSENLADLKKIIVLGGAHTEKLRTRIGIDVAETINPWSFPGEKLATRAFFASVELESAFITHMREVPVDLMSKSIQ